MVVQIVLLSKLTLSRDEDLQYAIETSQSIPTQYVTITRQTINKVLYTHNPR